MPTTLKARMIATRPPLIAGSVRNPKYATITSAMNAQRYAMNLPCVTR